MKALARLAFGAAAALLLASTSVSAAGYTFKIVNQSGYIIDGFYTNEGDGWSENWMDFKLDAGETGNMEFNANGPCDISFMVTWEADDGSSIDGDETTINICEAKKIYFDGKDATYD